MLPSAGNRSGFQTLSNMPLLGSQDVVDEPSLFLGQPQRVFWRLTFQNQILEGKLQCTDAQIHVRRNLRQNVNRSASNDTFQKPNLLPCQLLSQIRLHVAMPLRCRPARSARCLALIPSRAETVKISSPAVQRLFFSKPDEGMRLPGPGPRTGGSRPY